MKGNFNKGHYESIQYPVNLRRLGEAKSGLINPKDGKIHRVPEPAWPGSDEFKAQTDALISLTLDVDRGNWPGWYLEFCDVEPELSPVLKAVGLSEGNPQACANHVRMDQPSELWMAITSYAAENMIPLKQSIPVGVDFLGRFVDAAALFHSEVKTAMHKAFEVKYYYGLERPEEFFNCPSLSVYAEGCPSHPSYIAGHGTVAGVANRVFNAVYDPEPHQARDVEAATKQFAVFRDYGRVHLKQDSINGWKFGNGDYG